MCDPGPGPVGTQGCSRYVGLIQCEAQSSWRDPTSDPKSFLPDAQGSLSGVRGGQTYLSFAGRGCVGPQGWRRQTPGKFSIPGCWKLF
jgi:hypothetical protein